LPLASPWDRVEDVAAGLAAIERAFLARRDRRAVFATAYRLITRQIQDWITAGQFADGDWAARYLVAFGNLYRRALEGWERGASGAVPKAWRMAFEAGSGGRSLVIQDLALGINAHINHDLALALAEVGIDPERPRCYADHVRVNAALRQGTDALQACIADMYAKGLGVLDRLLGRLDEEVTLFSVEVARENAWVSAVALVDGRADAQRQRMLATLDARAGAMARLILSGGDKAPWFLEAMRHVEQLRPWWEHLSAAGRAPRAPGFSSRRSLGRRQPGT
jgi:hypothetical protein